MKIMNANAQKGFTLIELMIALVLGLIIVAAVTQVYIMAFRTGTTQRAAAGILDANVYGIQHIEKSLRMSGLGLDSVSQLNHLCGGIVYADSSYNAANENCFANLFGSINNPYTSGFDLGVHGTLVDGGVRPNTTNTTMPQLTIQYRAPVNMRDCEGNLALGPRKAVAETMGRRSQSENGVTAEIDVDGQVIVERYFVARNNTTSELELRCDAGRYITEIITSDQSGEGVLINDGGLIQGIGDTGALIISGIDDFQIQLGVKNGSAIQYRKLGDLPSDQDVVSLKMAVLTRGMTATTSDVPTNLTYSILGEDVQMNSNNADVRAIRRVYETTTMLRNSRGS